MRFPHPQGLCQTLRARLSIWYTVAAMLMLLAYSAGIYLWSERDLAGKLDRDLREDFSAAEANLKLVSGLGVVWQGNYEHLDNDPPEVQRWIEVWSPAGQLVYSNRPRGRTAPPLPAGCKGAETFQTYLSPGLGRVRSLCGLSRVSGEPLVVRLSHSLSPISHSMRGLLFVMMLAFPLAFGISVGCGYLISGRALVPLVEISRRARDINADRLAERLPVVNPKDELGRLAVTFNEAFGRLEKSFEQVRRFTADASHELRTPLTAIRSVGEVYLGHHPEGPGADAVASMLEETDRMRVLIENLLVLSKVDAGQVQLRLEFTDLVELAEEVVGHLEVLAEEKEQQLALRANGQLIVPADRIVLRQALINLVHNAIKYSPSGKAISLEVKKSDQQALISVSDEGPGISEEHRQRIFDRFYRVEKSRSRELGGAGLGLAIAKWAVEMHGGRIALVTGTAVGSVFTIELPLRKRRSYET